MTPFVDVGFAGDYENTPAGFGVALGYGVTNRLALEGDFSFTPDGEQGVLTEFDSTVWSLSGNVLYHFLAEDVTPYVALGLGVLGADTNAEDTGLIEDDTSYDLAWNWGGGLKTALNDRFGLRGSPLLQRRRSRPGPLALVWRRRDPPDRTLTACAAALPRERSAARSTDLRGRVRSTDASIGTGFDTESTHRRRAADDLEDLQCLEVDTPEGRVSRGRPMMRANGSRSQPLSDPIRCLCSQSCGAGAARTTSRR